jgi:lipopolysaccharide transport system permease protein
MPRHLFFAARKLYPGEVSNVSQNRGTMGGSAGLQAFWRPLETLLRNGQLYRRVLVRDIQSTFRGSALGLAWVVLIPLVLVAIYTFVFGVVLPSTWSMGTHTRLEVPLLFFTGLTVFGFFMEVVARSPNFIRENDVYVKKIVFPLEILPWVLIGTALFKFAINFALLLVFLAVVTGGVPLKVLLMPLVLAPFLLMTAGLSWLLTAVGTYVRDLQHAIQALAPIIMFISPIFYSVQQVPEPFDTLYYANPLTFVLESVRGLLFFDTVPSATGLLVFAAASLLVYAAGYAFFQRARPGFADVV